MNTKSFITTIPADADPDTITTQVQEYLKSNHVANPKAAHKNIIVYVKAVLIHNDKFIQAELNKNIKALTDTILNQEPLKSSKAAYAEAKVIRSLLTFHTVEVTYGIKTGKNRCRSVARYRLTRNMDGTIKNRVRLST